MINVKVIAEFGQGARGDVDVAIAQATAASVAGCFAAKFQCFQPERLASKAAPRYWSPELGGSESQLKTFRRNRTFTLDGWKTLVAACDEIGIKFACSPFDYEAVDMLDDLGCEVFKIASGEITHVQMLRRIQKVCANTHRQVILSAGAATRDEIWRALDWLDGCKVTVLACSLAYPTSPVDANLLRIDAMSGLPCPVGFSDHTTLVETGMAAVMVGAVMLEKHCRLQRGSGVPDDRMALTPDRLAEYVRLANLGAQLCGRPDLRPSSAEAAARAGARRSLHTSKPLRRGHVFEETDFVMLRPAEGGYAPFDVGRLVGRKLTRTLGRGDQIRLNDVAQ